MNEALKIFLSLSLSGSLLILILFFSKPLYKNKLSKQWQYYIWLIVIARLLLPFTPETSLIGNIFQKINNASIQMEVNPQLEQNGNVLPQTDFTLNSVPDNGTANGPAGLISDEQLKPESTPLQSALLIIRQNIWIVWLMVAIALLIRKITIYQSFVKYIKAGQVEISDIELWERFGKLVEQSGMKRAVGIYTNSLISSPLLIGFFRPCIMLPTTEISQSDFKYTILHELTHYKRRDMFYKWLVQLTICLHWFNPFVYLMGREINRACELSCDETVIAKLNINEHRAYGDTLLTALGIGGNYKSSLASVTLSESKELLKERLDAIMGFKKTTRLTAAISVALVWALCFGATAAGAYTNISPINEKENTANQPEQQNTSVLSPTIDRNLTLVEKEYTVAEINSLNVSGIVVEVLSENVLITKGGETLKVEYYVRNQNDYTLQNELDDGGTFEELTLRRISTETSDTAARIVSITIPENINFKMIGVTTTSGNIYFENCVGENGSVDTLSGQVLINGGSFSEFFTVKTNSATALISGTILPVRGVNFTSAKFHTENGTIMFQPAGSAWDYRYRLNTGEEAQIFVNGKQYQGGGGNINNFSRSQISVEVSNNGSFIVQDFSMGKLSLESPALQSNSTNPALQPKPDSGSLTATKEATSYWTEEEFIRFMQEQEQDYKKLLASGDITQKEFDIFISEDKATLKEIQNGTKISKAATGSIDNGIGA